MGYTHPRYVASLREFGEPRELPECGGWILVRKIPGTPYKDAMGCYPLFACRDWTKLHKDMEHIGSDLVSLTLVPDPLNGIDPSYLSQHFNFVRPFKTHYLVDLSQPLESFIGKSHRKNARRSLEMMDVEICSQPARYLDDWIRLYDNLINKHAIRGINAFSPQCFEAQLNVPGMIMVLGRREGEIVGATLVLQRDHVAYFHLSAYNAEGYRIRASYGTHWRALVYGYEQGMRYFHLGGIAGTKEDPGNGLAEFKRGWSNERRTVYFCGHVFDREKYDFLCRQKQTDTDGYFPGYRTGELRAHDLYIHERPIMTAQELQLLLEYTHS
jgi:hypothetical protein